MTLFFLFFFNNPAIAEDIVLLEIDDPLNDDYGPGTYQYPTDEAFQEKGLFDITSFSISRSGEKYRFKLVFANLTDPWGSKFGFSLPLIEMYIGKRGSGITELYKEGANIKLDPNFPWSTLLKISGWWVRLYKPDDMNREENIWDAEINPADLEDVELNVSGNTIIFYLNQEIVGDLENAHIYLLIGSFDPFGPDNFRTIKSDTNSWNFSDLTSDSLEFAPRVIDIVLPVGTEQSRILANFEEDYPTVVPIKIGKELNNIIFIPYLFFIVILLALALFVMNKKPPVRNNR